HNRAGETDAAAKILAEAIDLSRRHGDARTLARAALASTGLRWTGGINAPELMALLDEAADGVRGLDDALRANLLARQSAFQIFVDQDRLVALADEARATARASVDPGAIGTALTAR